MFAKDHPNVLTLSVMRQFPKMASRLTLQEHAPTLQNEFALPTCSQCLEILLRFHGQDAPWASQIANEMSNQAAMWSSWYCATKIKLHFLQGKIQVKVDYLPSFLHHGCFEHLPWDTFKQSQSRQVNSFIILRQLVNASCKPTLSPGVNSWSQPIANPGGPRGQASASTQKLNPKG